MYPAQPARRRKPPDFAKQLVVNRVTVADAPPHLIKMCSLRQLRQTSSHLRK